MSHIQTTAMMATVWLFATAYPAIAAGPAKQGSYDGMTCYVGTHHVIAGTKGTAGGSYEVILTGVAKEGDPFYNTAGRCVGSYVVIGEELNEYGFCTYSDIDGDAYFGTYDRHNKAPGNWKVTGGTGKYDQMQMTGTFVFSVQPPQPLNMLQGCSKVTGIWKLK